MIAQLLALRVKPSDLFFSLKTFAGAMLALFIALKFGLEKPYWAMGTAYIVSQPLSGALSSKSAYRAAGTVLGAVMAVICVPALVNAPELLSLALALWVGLCLAVSLLDRTPRAYVFMLAGYTAAIIGFPSVADPSAVFETAVARVEEILLGIACAGLIGHLVFPRHVGPVIAGRMDAWLKDAGALALGALAGEVGEEPRKRRARLAFDASELHGLAVHLDYDGSELRGTTRQLQALRGRMLLLLPLLASIGDRVAALKAEGLPPALAEVLAGIAAWTEAAEAADPMEAARLRAALADLKPEPSPALDWRALQTLYLLDRLRLFMDLREECRALWAAVRAGRSGLPALGTNRRLPPPAPVHRDVSLALLSGAAASLSILLCCAFWIASGWPEGAGAAQMAAISASLMAGFDDPVPALLSFIRGTLVALVAVCVYQFAVLPGLDGFPLLVAALALYLVPCGTLLAIPAWAGTGMALAVNFSVLIGIQERFSADFASFLNGNLAAVAAMGLSAVVLALVRSMGTERAISRLLAANGADFAQLVTGPATLQAEPLAGRMLDRLGLLAPRIAKAGAAAPSAGHALREVSAAINVADLKRVRPALPEAARAAVDRLLPALAAAARTWSSGPAADGVLAP
ncbi:FUSC family protein, partial [Azorhizobium sp. AG788]|uniref:FUSC family protein n=1 Tax=Azorhizobium sp. AG788 TaxID=2183897 RepID=UPI0031397D54